MFKLFVFAAVMAVAAAGIVSPALPLAYSQAIHAAPALSYAAAPVIAAPAIAAPAIAAAPALTYAAAAPAVVAAPAPVTYTSGYKVINQVEPVEQHGYKIVY